MGRRKRLATRQGIFVALAAAALTACSSTGDLSIINKGPTDVTVSTGDEEVSVSGSGGVVILDYGCTSADVTVEFHSGRTVVVSGSVCPDEQIVIHDGKVEVRPD